MAMALFLGMAATDAAGAGVVAQPVHRVGRARASLHSTCPLGQHTTGGSSLPLSHAPMTPILVLPTTLDCLVVPVTGSGSITALGSRCSPARAWPSVVTFIEMDVTLPY